MALRKRGRYWWIKVWDRETGTHIERSTRKEKKRLAEVVHADFVRDLAQDRENALLGVQEGTKISLVLDRYAREVTITKRAGTQRRERGILKQLRRFFVEERGDPDIGNLSAADVAAMMSWKAAEGVSPRTTNLYRATLRYVFVEAKETWGLELVTNPFDRAKARDVEKYLPYILTRKEYEDLLEAADDVMLRLFILTLTETGARSESEVLQLRWDDLDLDEGFIHIRSEEGSRTKTGKSRWVPMSPRLHRAIRHHAAEYRFSLGSPWVFCHLTPRGSKNGGVERGDRIVRMYRGFKAAAVRARLGVYVTEGGRKTSRLRPHDLRHTFVTWKLTEGHSPVLVRDVVGHADLATTMSYYEHVQREDLRSVVGGAKSALSPIAAGQ